MLYKPVLVTLAIVGLVIVNIFYILTLGKLFLKIFDKSGKNPKLYILIDGLASIFTTSPLSEKARKEREFLLKASSQVRSDRKTYMELKINLPDVIDEKSQSSLSEHIPGNTEKTDQSSKSESITVKPQDIVSNTQYLNTLKEVLGAIDNTMEGIQFIRSSTIVHITNGDMKKYKQLSKIRSELAKTSGLILKVDVKLEVKKTFANIHFKLQEYINHLIKGLDDLLDYIYRGDKRLMQEGQRALKEADKRLAEIRRQLNTIRHNKDKSSV